MQENFKASRTDRPYILMCNLKFYKKTVHDNGNTYERKLCLLVPEESDQRTAFLNAWLPETREEYFEINSEIEPPIDSPCRLSIHRGGDDRSERHYLYVMSIGVEEDLVLLPEGRRLKVKILAEDSEGVTDNVEADGGNFHKI
jgi:hypothetical protein